MQSFKQLVLVPLLVLVAFQVHAAETAPAVVKSEILLKSDHSWDGAPYVGYPAGRPELSLVRIVIPPHTALPWHTHPIPNAAYVVSGTLQVELRGSSKIQSLHAGDTLSETVNTVHRGVTGEQPVELLVFYAGAPGVPLSAPAP